MPDLRQEGGDDLVKYIKDVLLWTLMVLVFSGLLLLASAILDVARGSGSVPSEGTGPSRYRIHSGYGIPKLVIRGDGCLTAEDMTKLRLVDWDPANNRVVYRCVQP